MRNPYVPFKAAIRGIRQEAGDVKTFLLEPESGFPPGAPGQFNMVGCPGVGEAPVSLSRVPMEDSDLFEHTIRAVGRVTDFLSTFREGDEIFLRGPFGRGWPLNEVRGKHLVLVSGGLGLAPIRPVVQIADKLKARRITLLHGARDPGSVIFKTEFKHWRKKGIDVELTVDEPGKGWRYHTGIVTEIIRRLKIAPAEAVAIICGPEIMMRFAANELFLKDVPGSSVYVSPERRMRCGMGLCGHCQHGVWFVCKDGPVFSYRELRGYPDALF